MQKLKRVFMAAALMGVPLLSSHTAQAESTPYVMPQDSRIVVFRYDPYQTFTVLARVGVPTAIKLAPGEKLEKFILGDTVRWVVADAPGMVFVKPIEANLYTAGTIVTDKRAYQIQLRSSPESGIWYQQVSWKYPSMIALARAKQAKHRLEEEKRARARAAMRVAYGLDPERLNFGYRVEGNLSLKPVQVFDDGKFTWIQMKDLQTLPALFVMDDGKPSLVNYTVKGQYLVVQQLFREALLKRGEVEARIVNTNRRSLSRVIDGSTQSEDNLDVLDGDY